MKNSPAKHLHGTHQSRRSRIWQRLGVALLAISASPSCGRTVAPTQKSEPQPRAALHPKDVKPLTTASSNSSGAPRVSAAVKVEPKPAIPFAWFEDAPEAALAKARAERKPLFVDLWAPWCHTCLSMRAYVLTQNALPGLRDKLVLLAVNTEMPKNAAFLEKFPVSVWPTFYVIDPESATLTGRWLGAGSPGQLMRFISDSTRALSATAEKSGANDSLALVLEGDRLATQGEYASAARKYAEALKRAPADWPRRPDVLVSRISALLKANEYGACIELANASMDETGNAVSAGDFAHSTLSCIERAGTANSAVETLKRAERRLSALCESGSAELTADDRADACSGLRRAREALKDPEGAKRALQTALSVIEAASQDQPDELAVMYDFARIEALSKLGRADEAITLLQARERALPDSYNPPHYLARLYRDLRRWDPGLAAIERALGKAYGPRKAGLLGVKVDLLVGAERKDEARKVLEDQLALYRNLPLGQKQAAAEGKVAARLAGWK